MMKYAAISMERIENESVNQSIGRFSLEKARFLSRCGQKKIFPIIKEKNKATCSMWVIKVHFLIIDQEFGWNQRTLFNMQSITQCYELY